MEDLDTGDRVRIDIPDETDPDYNQFHGEHGTITSTIQDDLSEISGKEGQFIIYRVELDSGVTMDFRHHDLRPPIK